VVVVLADVESVESDVVDGSVVHDYSCGEIHAVCNRLVPCY